MARTWRLNYNGSDSEFLSRNTRARVQGQILDLPAMFLMENGRGLVPASSLPSLMQRLLRVPINFSRSVATIVHRQCGNPLHCTGEQTNPPTLVMNFTSPRSIP